MTEYLSKKIGTESQANTVADTVSGLFSTLADAMPQIVWATDADGSHFYYNRRWYEYTGMSEVDSMGFGFAIPLHPDDRERTLKRWQKAWDAGEDYDIEYRFRRQDGVYRWFVGRAMPVRDTQTGQVRMWIGTCTDIDDTRLAFEELRESQGRLSLALQAAKLGTWEFDYETQKFEISPRTAELVGVSSLTIPFDVSKDLVRSNDRDEPIVTLTAFIQQKPPYSAPDAVITIPYRMRRPDNTVRHLVIMGSRLFDANGTASRIVGVVQDVTDRQNTLDALRESADALRESESRFRSVVSNAPLVVFALDKNGILTFHDGAGLSSVGFIPGEKVGRSFTEVYSENPEIVHNLSRALRGELNAWTATLRGVRFEVQTTLLTDENGEPDGIIGVAFDVTEKSRAAEALAAREEQYRFLFNTVASGVVYQDSEARILDVNPAAERILGLTFAQMTGRDSFDPRWKAVKEDGTDFPGDEHPVPVALRTGATVRDVVMGIYHPQEEQYRWLSVSAVPLFREGETKPHLVYAYFVDQTEQKAAENRLRESEVRFRDLADNIAQLAWMANADGALFWYNQRWFEYTGSCLEEMRGQGWQKVHHPDYVQAVTTKYMDHVQRGIVWEDTFPLRGADGEYRWFLSRAVPVRNEAGEIVRWFGTNTDITESRRAEEKIRRSEERFRSLITATAQIVWLTRANGAFVSEQVAWSGFTGQSFDDYKGAGWIDAVHPDDQGETARIWQEAITSRQTFKVEHRLRRADGTYRYMSVRAVPVFEEDSSVREWIGVHTDITERKEAEFTLSEYAVKQARVAEILQRSLLNTPPANTFPGITFKTYYEAAMDEAEVGGDFFDLFALKNNKVAFIVGDVTGKGLKAAEHTGEIKYALRAFLRENPSPGDALARVNQVLTEAQMLDMQVDNNEEHHAMATIAVAVLDQVTGRLELGGGGVEMALWYQASSGTCTEILTKGLVVGAYEGSFYEMSEVTLESGDLLILTTDGITESRRGRREFFGNEGVIESLLQTTKRSSEPSEVIEAIVKEAKTFSASGRFRDDVCLLAVRRT